MTTPPSKIKDFAHLPLHRGGFSLCVTVRQIQVYLTVLYFYCGRKSSWFSLRLTIPAMPELLVSLVSLPLAAATQYFDPACGRVSLSIPSPSKSNSHPGGVAVAFGAGYGRRTRLHGLGSRCITDIRTLRRVHYSRAKQKMQPLFVETPLTNFRFSLRFYRRAGACSRPAMRYQT